MIQFVDNNGCTCCINTTTTKATSPSLAFVDPNGTTQYIAMTTAAIAGMPRMIGTDGCTYSMGVVPEEGGVRIHSNYVCIACPYNFNTMMCVCFCTDDNDWEFELGLNPTYGTSSNGWATVTWNSKNCTGTSPTIEEHFQCMCAHSTNANAITYWGTTMPACWNYVNACIAAGCDLDPKDGSSVLCTSYTLCVNDNCYWSQDTDYCFSSFNNHAAWSSCSWCKGCKPIGCWTSIDYYSYNMNRTSGTVSVGNRTVDGSGCRNLSNVVTQYSCWQSCSEESYGCWICCGYLTCYVLGPLCMCVYGSIPNGSVRVCNYGCCWCNGVGGVCVVIPATANTWTGGTGNYNWANPTFRMDYSQAISHASWEYGACTPEYYCTSICSSYFCGVMWRCCASDYYTPNVALIATGRWSDGTTSWTPPTRHATFTACIINSNCNGGQTNCRYCYSVYSNWGGSKSWQNWTTPQLIHAAW